MFHKLNDMLWSEAVWLPPNTKWEDVTPGPGKAVAYTDHMVLLYAIVLALGLVILRKIFENEAVWLPPNTKWEDVTPGPGKAVAYTDHMVLLYAIVLALGLVILRKIFEKFCFTPIGKSLGIRSSAPRKAPPNTKLEEVYKLSSKLNREQICGLTKQLDMTERQIERWWRLRRSQDKHSTLVKFTENMWRCTFYSYNFVYGLYILWDKIWLWDIDHCYIGHPHQGVTNDVWWYYMITLAFYWSLTISQFWDVRRKDFWQMFVHHIATIALISISWVCNLHRLGSLVIAVHDCSDIFLEAAKLANYAKYRKCCDCFFVLFTLVWVVSRLVIYPFHILRSMFGSSPLIQWFPAFGAVTALLLLLLVLHVYWTYLITQVIAKIITRGQNRDVRSSSSEQSDDSHESANRNVNNKCE